jgi:predicted deacylase
MTQPVFELGVPELSAWRAGNVGTEGVWHFDSGVPGRRLMVSALVHGNELCGAWVLRDALARGLRPRCGSLTLVLANLDAFDRFDLSQPDVSRFVDADMNRLWGDMPWRADASTWGLEHRRVLALQPWVERADWLLDLHSMHEVGEPLGLVGPLPHHAQQAAALGSPTCLVADTGHRAGTRLRDHGVWGQAEATNAFALLVECGWHGALSARTVAQDVFARFMLASGCMTSADLPAGWLLPTSGEPQLLRVEQAVTVASGTEPRFAKTWASGDCLPQAGTLVGWNGGQAFHTPFDDCVLVMPTLRHATPGATLVRLASRQALHQA